ncbi:hypothetical protein RI054_44g153040 [Pseudoscourfieldia marina]
MPDVVDAEVAEASATILELGRTRQLDSFIVAIAAGGAHSLALRRNGGVACWGWNNHGQAPPAGVEGDFVAIAAGSRHSLALRRNGTSVACWGFNHFGQAPPGGMDGDFVAIGAGAHFSVALRRDGSVACWGRNDAGQAPADGVPGPFKTPEVCNIRVVTK